MNGMLAPKLIRIESGLETLPARIDGVEQSIALVKNEQAELTERIASLQTVTMRLGVGTLIVAIVVLVMLIAG